ncbi:MAG: LytR C-terminal domain-containing protein [Burkholderiaceae bacterium]|nr:LytR C-terminal domain-containing protein [Microbacteriaceae bacterium]
MAAPTTTDRFDDIPDGLDRVGAHRAPPKPGRGWIGFAWAALTTGILVGLGVLALSVFTDSITNLNLPFSPETSTAAPADPAETTAAAVTPALDPAIAITVLNGTPVEGLANTVGDALVADGWEGAAIGVGSRSSAAVTDITATIVYYVDAADEAAALAVVETLGVGEARLSTDYPSSPMTVLIGSDYTPPTG